MSGERGIALILVTMAASFLSAIGLGLALIVFMDNLATGNVRRSVATLYAADAALELAVRELSHLDDWDAALNGEVRSAIVDGLPLGSRAVPGSGTVDLTVMNNQLTCGRSTACTEPDIVATTRERPWGRNNARWRLFAYGPPGNFVQSARPLSGYITVWVADDGRAEDDVMRIRVEGYGPAGIRRGLEAQLARLCLDDQEPCGRGIRVQSWHEVRQSIP